MGIRIRVWIRSIWKGKWNFYLMCFWIFGELKVFVLRFISFFGSGVSCCLRFDVGLGWIFWF